MVISNDYTINEYIRHGGLSAHGVSWASSNSRFKRFSSSHYFIRMVY